MIEKYRVNLGFLKKEFASFDVLAGSESDAIEIARRMLKENRRDYESLVNIVPQNIIKEQAKESP